MRVLILGVDCALGLFLEKGLKLEGHEASYCQSSDHDLDTSVRYAPDVLILGVAGQDADLSLIATVRQRLEKAVILVLSEPCDVEDRVRYLDYGADDCLLKPFSFHELTARCRAIARRFSALAGPALHVGALKLDLVRNTVERNGSCLELTRKEFGLLESLARRGGACCSREELLSEVWQAGRGSSTNVVDVYVTYLRKKLLAMFGPACSSIIETVRGSGYRINPNCYLLARQIS